MLHILAISLDFEAPVHLRERCAVSAEQYFCATQTFLKCPSTIEVAILSTCNRVEVYLVTNDVRIAVQESLKFFANLSGLPELEINLYLRFLLGEYAVFHLMQVASGLLSLVIGETQILCQVKQAYHMSQQHKSIGRVLHQLFKHSIRVAKRVRSETHISRGSVSISSAAVELAWRRVPDLARRRVAILGAGEMAKLLLKHLLAQGVSQIAIINRSIEGAQELARQFPKNNLQLHSFLEIAKAISNAEVVFTGTAATKPILSRTTLEEILEPEQSITFFDISVPRNISHDAKTLPNVEVYCIDDLQEVVAQNHKARQEIAVQVEALLREELAAFKSWWQSLTAVPTIDALNHKFENLRKKEIHRLKPDFLQQHKAEIDFVTRGIVQKISHFLIMDLKKSSSEEVLILIQRIFHLDIDRS